MCGDGIVVVVVVVVMEGWWCYKERGCHGGTNEDTAVSIIVCEGCNKRLPHSDVKIFSFYLKKKFI